MSKKKYQRKRPRVPAQAIIGIGKYEGEGPYVPSKKEMEEAIVNARKIIVSNDVEELRKKINKKKQR